MKYFLALLITFPCHAFILTEKGYELKFDKEAKVYVSSEGCSANGISDGELGDAIKTVIEDYWNRVPESRLKLKFGGTSTASITAGPPSSGILVGCGSLSSGIAGSTNNNKSRGSSVIVMSSSYTSANSGFIGTLAHEMGHSLGLAHSKDKASVMTYESNGWGAKPKYLSQDDKDGVVYLYPNEKELGGIVPSCDSFASDGTSQQTGLGNFIFSTLLGALIIGFFLRRII